jgi:hypothetical protein
MEEKCRQASGCRSPCLEPGSYISGARLNEGTQDDNARPNRSTAQDADDTLVAYPAGDHHVGMLSWKQETGASMMMSISGSASGPGDGPSHRGGAGLRDDRVAHGFLDAAADLAVSEVV